MPTATNNYESVAESALEYLRRHAGPSLTEPQNRQLGALVRAGNAAAREQMIEGNISLALTFSAALVPCWDRDEVLSNALLGLIDAVDKYDPSKGVFSSYAKIKVRQGVIVAFANQRPLIRVPRNVAHKLARWRKAHGDSDEAMPPHLAAVAALEQTLSLDTKIGDDEFTIADTIAAADTDFPPGEREEIEEKLASSSNFVEELDAISARPPSVARPAANNSCGGLNHNQNKERNTTMTNQTTKTIRAASGCEEKQAWSSRSRNYEAGFENSTMPQQQSKPGQQLEFDFPGVNTASNYGN